MSVMPKAIENKVNGFRTMSWSELKGFDFNELKEVSGRDVSKLKRAIVSEGFCFPIEIWEGHDYVIDGRGRDQALRELEQEGYAIPDLPVIEIRADDLSHAKRLVLMRSSQHGQFTQAAYDRFVDDIDVAGLEELVSIPGIDIGVLGSSIGDVRPPDSFEDLDADLDTQHRCPKCAYEWSGTS